MITNPVDGMRVQYVDKTSIFAVAGIGTLRQGGMGSGYWLVEWPGEFSLPFLWAVYGDLFELADAPVPPAPAASTEPMTDRERLIARRAREGHQDGYGFVT